MGQIQVEGREQVTILTINRPEAMNAISRAMWGELGRNLDRLAKSRPWQPVILRGAGGRAFSAGSDLAEFHRMSIAEVNATFLVMEETIARVERMPMPVIAAVGGFALGSALELVCACDIQVAAESGRLGMPVARLGIMLSPAFARRIAALIGPAWTRYLLFTGRQLTAAEARNIGLVNEVVPGPDLEQRCLDLAAEMAGYSRHSVRAAKASVFASLPAPSPGSADGEPPYYLHEADFREGVAAFLEKRRPRFAETDGGQGAWTP